MWSTSIRIPRMAWTIFHRSVNGCSTPILVFKTRPFETKFKIFKQYAGKASEQSEDSAKQTARDEAFTELKHQIEDVGGNDRLSQNEKNKIWNFTLLDSSTNRSYGNAIFPAKRRVIIGKDQGKKFNSSTIDENGQIVLGSAENSPSAFIPPCTRYVFLKYYNTASFDPNVWTRNDAEAYKDNIIEVLKNFLS